MTLEEMAGRMNCTRERVRQLEKIAIGKIREYVERLLERREEDEVDFHSPIFRVHAR